LKKIQEFWGNSKNLKYNEGVEPKYLRMTLTYFGADDTYLKKKTLKFHISEYAIERASQAKNLRKHEPQCVNGCAAYG